jgi:hypothetical protein
VRPALQRQITTVERVRRTATPDAGVWKLPDGDAYYAAKLKWFTTTDMTAEEVHQLGLQQVAELTSRLDAVLRSQGYTTGTVLQRLQAINVDPAQTYPNTDPGRAELIASLNAQIVDLDARLPRAFNRLPRAKVEVRRVPPETQDGAANGYYQSASLDGSRPGAYYINLKDTTEWPKWSLPTLTYHEANPGHHFQNTIALEIRRSRCTGARSSASPRTARAGACTPSRWRTSWGCTTPIRSGGWAAAELPVPGGAAGGGHRHPPQALDAGAGQRLDAERDRRSRRARWRARSTATSPTPARPAPTRSGRP